jgi:hypothetical protein
LIFAAVLPVAQGAAARRASGPLIICPQTRGSVPASTCCGPPIERPDVELACCTTLVECGPTVTIASSKNPALEGSELTISGTLTGTSASGKTVTLWQEAAGAKSFTQSQTTSTGGGGSYSFKVAAGAVKTNTEYYVTTDGPRSSTLDQQINARVTLSAKRDGRRFHLSGTVAPAQAGKPIRLQRLAHGQWVTFASTHLNRNSSFSWKTKAGRRGRSTVRALFPGDSRNVESTSRTVKSPT